MSEQSPKPDKQRPKLDYAGSESAGKKPFAWLRVLLILLLVVLGAGVLIFGLCTYLLAHA